MDEQNGQILSITGIKSEKKIRIGTGLGFRNSSQVQRNLNKNFVPAFEQNLSNGPGQTLTLQHQISAPASNNQFIVQNSPQSNLISSQLVQNNELAQNPSMTSSQGFFRRKINLKMSTTNLKAFLNKQPSDNNPLMIKSSKSRFVGSHLSQGNIQGLNSNPNIGSQQQQQNYFSSQQSLQHASIMQNSSNNHSPSAYNSIMNSINSDHNSVFQNGTNSGHGNNSNLDSLRSINSNDQITNQTNQTAKQGENISIFSRGMRLSRQSSKNSSQLKQQNTNEKFKKKIINEESQYQENQDLEENNEDQNSLRNNSMTKNTISNYSHNTESTNVTAQISHHNYGNQSIQNNFSDLDKTKNKQISSHPSAYTSQTTSQTNIPTIYVKKKINEAKQYSNQVRQQIFVKQDQEEEENFLELCETLNKINYN